MKKTLTIIAAAVVLVAILLYSQAFSVITLDPITVDPIHWWKFDENAGTTAFDTGTDSIPFNGDGTMFNFDSPSIPTSGWSDGGIHPPSLVFNGTDDYIDCGDAASLDLGFTSDMSWTCWVYLNSFDNHRGIVDKRLISGGFQQGYFLYVNLSTPPLGRVFWSLEDNSSRNIDCFSTTQLELHKWYFIAAILDNNAPPSGAEVASLYINGILEDTDSDSWLTSPANGKALQIGRWHNTISWRYMEGYIDDLRLYDIALTGSEVMRLYQTTLAAPMSRNFLAASSPASVGQVIRINID